MFCHSVESTKIGCSLEENISTFHTIYIHESIRAQPVHRCNFIAEGIDTMGWIHLLLVASIWIALGYPAWCPPVGAECHVSPVGCQICQPQLNVSGHLRWHLTPSFTRQNQTLQQIILLWDLHKYLKLNTASRCFWICKVSLHYWSLFSKTVHLSSYNW